MFDPSTSPAASCPSNSVLRSQPRLDFLLFARVMRERLSTGLRAERPGSVLPRQIFAGPADCTDLVKFL